jgi:hypothetical protein
MVFGTLCVTVKYMSDRGSGCCLGSANRYWCTANCKKYGSFQRRQYPAMSHPIIPLPHGASTHKPDITE